MLFVIILLKLLENLLFDRCSERRLLLFLLFVQLHRDLLHLWLFLEEFLLFLGYNRRLSFDPTIFYLNILITHMLLLLNHSILKEFFYWRGSVMRSSGHPCHLHFQPLPFLLLRHLSLLNHFVPLVFRQLGECCVNHIFLIETLNLFWLGVREAINFARYL